ncbi:MAG: hypothetical protein RLZ98_613 [Pseudomonadota bacterium]|jgi:tripartite-type tricarboxylate transporter receptor subunit TctC
MTYFAKFAAFALLAISAPLAAPAGAQDFYKGKTVSIVVGFSPGGGFDTYARSFGRHLGKHLPGGPKVIIQNMPGAGSMKSVLHLDANAPKDGTVLAAFNPGLITLSATSPEQVKIRFDTLAWVGSISPDFSICYAWHATGIKKFGDIRGGREFIVGASGKGTSSYVRASIMRALLGANVKHVLGFPGSAEQRLAVERGELHGDCGAWSSIPDTWIKGKKIVPLLRFDVEKLPDMPDGIPLASDLATSDENRKALDLLLASGKLGRPYVMSKAVPANRLAEMRRAFDATMKDPDFRADATKQAIPVYPVDGAGSERIIVDVYAAPAGVVARARAAIQ